MFVPLAMARGLRRSPESLVGLSAVLIIGIGASLGSLEAAARTDNAYPSYLRRAQVGELVVNPNLITERAEDIIGSTPGVRGYVSDSILAATPDRGEARTEAELDSDLTQVRMSGNGRHADQDRPVIQEGRMIGQGAEVLVNVEMAEALSIKVGDTLPLAFWSGFSRTPFAHSVSLAEGGEEPSPGQSGRTSLVEPLGRAEPRVVGDRRVPGRGSRRRALPVSSGRGHSRVGARFACTYGHPRPDDTNDMEQIIRSILPARCATAYQYFSLRVDGGDRGVGDVIRSLAERSTVENDRLPAALKTSGIGFEVIPTVTAEERQRVQSSLAPAVTALQLFGVGAGSLHHRRRRARSGAPLQASRGRSRHLA